MTLALRLGMTLQDLRENMSAEELFLWQAYNEESPLSDARGDIQAAIIAASSLQAQGAKVTPMDLLPQWKAEKPAAEQLPEEGEELFKAFLMAKAVEV
ncbi:phage tail protein [Pseudomonas guariconensis]|uniref:Phage tail protein n=1 Tax=Pseudomonas guariconensis TaxID=1288410 RepID=A0AAX0VPZ6_9PSED|nr:phage tail protein [Pseudomonas guariconensis]PLV21537.1 phage tail protein [Pseudomonas guariconensis]PLV26654.1 phage tail protein [Pseudomonas guariconensis]